MKKLLCILLSAIVLCTVLMPVTAFAENGPYPPITDDSEYGDYEVSMIMAMTFSEESEETEYGVIYPETEVMPAPAAFKGASYDLATNTLTLKNVKAGYGVLVANAMGDDFKIKLIGYNEIGALSSMGGKRGAAITLVGDGELVINKEFVAYSGVSIEADDTAAFFRAEKDVDLKIHANEEYGVSAVEIVNSTITDPQQLIVLDGTVREGGIPVTVPSTVDVYEQISTFNLTYDITETADYVFKKDDVLYMGFDAIEYDDDYNETVLGHYIFPVFYDEALGCYATDIIEDEDEYIVADYAAAGYEMLAPEAVPVSFRNIFTPSIPCDYNLAFSEDGTVKYAFEMYDYGDGEVEYEVYKVIEHEKYGNLIQLINKTDLSGLVPQKIGEKQYLSAIAPRTIVMNEGGSVAPAAVKLVSVKPALNGVTVSWKPLANAEKYRIYRKAAGDKSWTILDTVSGAQKSSFADTTAKSGVKYTYTVKAYNKVGAGAYDKTGLSIYYLDNPNVTLKNVNGGINVSWAAVKGAKTYTVYRKAAGEKGWTAIKKNLTATSFKDTTAKSGVTYSYTARAVNGKNASTYGEWKIICLSMPKLNKPANTLDGVKVSWSKVAGAKEYIVYRMNDKTKKWEKIGVTAKTAFIDEIGPSNYTATYTVKAASGKTYSAYNKTGVKVTHIKAPAVTLTNKSKGVQLKWADVAGATGFKVYRRVKGTTAWTALESGKKAEFKKSGSVYVYGDTTVKSGVTYEYAVRALGKTSNSAYEVKEIMFLSVPKLLSAKNSSDNSGVKFTWGKVSGTKSYTVYRKTGNGDWEVLAKTSATSYVDNNTVAGNTYTYTVRAVNGTSRSLYNSGIKVKSTQTNFVDNPYI